MTSPDLKKEYPPHPNFNFCRWEVEWHYLILGIIFCLTTSWDLDYNQNSAEAEKSTGPSALGSSPPSQAVGIVETDGMAWVFVSLSSPSGLCPLQETCRRTGTVLSGGPAPLPPPPGIMYSRHLLHPDSQEGWRCLAFLS